jgi:hypothetical protein
MDENTISIKTNQGVLDVNIKLPTKERPKPQHPYNDFVVLNTTKIKSISNPYNNLWELMKNPDMAAECCKVLWGLVLCLEFDNFITISITEIAGNLNMHRANVSRCIRKLEKLGVVERGAKHGNSYSFRLNPIYCWKGNHSTLSVLLNHKKPKL